MKLDPGPLFLPNKSSDAYFYGCWEKRVFRLCFETKWIIFCDLWFWYWFAMRMRKYNLTQSSRQVLFVKNYICSWLYSSLLHHTVVHCQSWNWSLLVAIARKYIHIYIDQLCLIQISSSRVTTRCYIQALWRILVGFGCFCDQSQSFKI